MAKSDSPKVEELIADLQHKDAKVRLNAVESLQRMKSNAKSAVPAVIEALKDSSIDVRDEAVNFLGDLRPMTKGVVAALIDATTDPKIADNAMSTLASIGPEAVEALPYIAKALEKIKKPDPIWIYATWLASFGVKGVPYLIEFVTNKKGLLQEAAVSALVEIGAEAREAVRALLVACKGPSPEVCDLAIQALGAIGVAEPAVIRAVAEALKDPATSDSALRALPSFGPAASEAIPALIELMEPHDPEHDLSERVQCLGQLGPQSIPWLTKYVEGGHKRTRIMATSGLAGFGPAAASAIPALLRSLEQPHPVCGAVLALNAIGADPDIIIPAFTKLAKTASDQDVRRTAVSLICELGERASVAVPDLILLLEENSAVSAYTAMSISEIGPSAAAALPALRGLLNAKIKWWREAAESAISQITHEPPSAALSEKLAPPLNATTLDFGRTKIAVATMLAEGLANFAVEHPDVEVSSIGLFGVGFGAYACLCLEIPENDEDARIAKAIEQDRVSEYVPNGVYDFTYSQYETVSFDWWPSLYEVGSSFKILMPDGRLVRKDLEKYGNDAINKPLAQLLKGVLKEAWPIKGLKFAKSFRLAVDIAHSDCFESWKPKHERAPGK